MSTICVITKDDVSNAWDVFAQALDYVEPYNYVQTIRFCEVMHPLHQALQEKWDEEHAKTIIAALNEKVSSLQSVIPPYEIDGFNWREHLNKIRNA